jgi:hypothetical protein
MNIVRDTDPVVQEGRDARSDHVERLLPWWMEVLKEVEVLYPGWKAPKLEHLHVECVEQTVKAGDLLP